MTVQTTDRAYRYVDTYFIQTDEPRDLDPALIGRESGYQIMPSWAPTFVIGKRLAELGYGGDITNNQPLLVKMRAMMNVALNEGRQVRFDEPEHLTALLDAAVEALGGKLPEAEEAASAAALTQRYR